MLWLNPAVGVSGDMLLGALIDVGADEVTVRNALETLEVGGWELAVGDVDRRGLQCLHAQVTTAVASEPRTWSGIDSLLARSSLPSRVVEGSRATFRKLAKVEAERHGVEVDDVHFHEVGAVDAIVDIVGCWAALDALHVTEVRSGPVGLGVGTVQSSHGALPHPAPAVLGLLEGLPVVGVNSATETATPTGVALLATMVDEWGPIAPGRLYRTGFGAGSRDVEAHPNILTAVMIDIDDSTIVDAVLIETNLDDVTPEILALVVQRALDAGADDAWLVSIGMKKGRPGHQLSVLCAPGLRGKLVDLVAIETGTLGVRVYDVAKHVFPRSFEEIELDGEMIRMKVGTHGAKPESADVVRVANATGKSARLVAAEALSRWMRATSEEEAN
jgi:hypothetical protein